MSGLAMPGSYAVRGELVDGHDVRVLASPAHALEAAFVPPLGMLGCSLRHRGEELLGQRRGLAAYVERASTMGIPLLHPWANRLGGFGYEVAGRTVTLEGGTPIEEHGLPIHGLIAAVRGWSAVRAAADDSGATVAAELDAGARPDVLAGFPFPHVIRVEARLHGGALTIQTTLRATGEVPVPISFGYHPYLRLPAVPRESWHVEIPVARRLVLDDRSLPTGASEAVVPIRGALGRRTLDDGFVRAQGEGPFVLAGGGRRIEVTFDEGYPYTQIFAPPDDDVICFEPMTAPADALRGPLGPPAMVAPGAAFRASFSIAVRDA
jgi:galactose mutarotase-like enzyme